MAVQVNVSSPLSGTAAVFSLLTELCTAGWLVKAWSDATTYTGGVSLSTNPYGSASSGAGNLGNTSAWFRVASADGSREWLFFRGAADQTWTISRSKAGFTGGAPNATTAGTATDATALFSAAQAFPTSQWRMYISCESASPYGFTCFGITLGGGNVLHFLVDEPLLSGTTDTSDTDPYLWWGYWNGTGLAASTGAIRTMMSTPYKRFTAAGSNQQSTLGVITNETTGSGAATGIAPASGTTAQMGLTPNNLTEVPIRIPVFRVGASSSTTGWIGLTNRLRWSTVSGRANGQTLAQGTSAYWIFMAGAWVPWNSTTPSLS